MLRDYAALRCELPVLRFSKTSVMNSGMASTRLTRLLGSENTYGPRKDLTKPGTGGNPDGGGEWMIV